MIGGSYLFFTRVVSESFMLLSPDVICLFIDVGEDHPNDILSHINNNIELKEGVLSFFP